MHTGSPGNRDPGLGLPVLKRQHSYRWRELICGMSCHCTVSLQQPPLPSSWADLDWPMRSAASVLADTTMTPKIKVVNLKSYLPDTQPQPPPTPPP